MTHEAAERPGASAGVEPPGVPRAALRIDRARCVGAGLCVVADGDVFDQDPADGMVLLLGSPADAASRAGVHDAVRSCPSGALTFTHEAQV